MLGLCLILVLKCSTKFTFSFARGTWLLFSNCILAGIWFSVLCVYLPRVVLWSDVYDCAISWSYCLFVVFDPLENMVTKDDERIW